MPSAKRRLRWYWAACPLGLEEVLAEEIRALGGTDVNPGRSGVPFRGNQEVGYTVALWSRVAVRVFEEIERGKIRVPDDIYKVASRVQWSRYLARGQTFAIHGVARSRMLKQPHYGALKVKDAIADQLRAEWGERPNVDPSDPDIPLRVFVENTTVTISRDLCRGSLHKRGYRRIQHKSPLNEALAAGLLKISGWDGRSALCDPMCGSATLLIEAAFIAGDRAPGLTTRFAFEAWRDLDREAWTRLKKDAERRWAEGRDHIPPLMGNDRHPGALELAKKACFAAGVGDAIVLASHPVSEYVPPQRPASVVTNPPYGERLDDQDLVQSWYDLGAFLKEQAPGSTAWVLAGNREITRHLHMRASQKVPVFNGSIDCRWLKYEVRGPA